MFFVKWSRRLKMIDVIKQQFNENMSLNRKVNVTREFLQILCLKIMNEKKMFDHLAFLGGTSLRILYDLRRFSEDLDFSLINPQEYSFKEIPAQYVSAFKLYGLEINTKSKSVNNIDSMMLKFPGLLKELELSPMESQNISIKWDVDTNPPKEWNTANTIINKHFMFNIAHYDLSSLFAGKLHACFHRKFTKGRDWYDFIWYLTKKIKPNFNQLNNSVEQTENVPSNINNNNFKEHLLKSIETLDFNFVKKDVERFLDDKTELSLFDRSSIEGAINKYFL